MTETQRLLAEYVAHRSEPAFRELVKRYLDLVYSTALRLVGRDVHLAEDVAQMVFADLARKAKALPRDVMLGGWLHRHTCFVACKLMRAERRRQSRERQAVEMNAQPDHSQTNLSQLTPVLDEAINELDAEDRVAIVLRFFEQQDLRSVGETLGSSENAAQKRVGRALEELRSRLARRGVAFSVTALGTVLATQAVSAAPAGLAVAISTSALAGAAMGGGATLTLFKAMTMTKLQVGVISAVIVVGVATPILLHHESQIRAENMALRQQYEDLLLKQNAEEAPAMNSSPAQTVSSASNGFNELLRLRGEATRLRLELAEMQIPSNILRRSREAQAQAWQESIASGILLSEDEEQAGFPIETWAFSGYATPKAAAMSLMWAQAQGDTKTLFASYTPEALQWKFENQWRGKTEAEIGEMIKAGMGSITGFRVRMQSLNTDGNVVFRLIPLDAAGKEHPMVVFALQKVGDEWKSCNKGSRHAAAQP